MNRHPSLKRKWPAALNIVPSGQCPSCKRDTQQFFQLPGDGTRAGRDGAVEMRGGYYCERCGWSNAGAMEVTLWRDRRDAKD